MSNILTNQLVAVVEDEKGIRDIICKYLEDEGCNITTFISGEELLEYLNEEIPDLLLLDRLLPGMDGMEVCQTIRADEKLMHIPVLMFSRKGDVTDKITGLNVGADDYLPKPFDLEELKARMSALLRRTQAEEPSPMIEIPGGVTINTEKYIVCADGEKVNLTYAEYKILELLAVNKGQVFSRKRILEYVWPDGKDVVERTVDFHMTNLRKKIGQAGPLIKNVRSFGYVLDVDGTY